MIRLKDVRLNHFPESHLDLSVSRGEIVGLSGTNGAGKSTLLRFLAGLEPGWKPENGSEEQFFFSLSPDIRIAMVFQHAEDNLVFSTLREDIRFGLRCKGAKMIESEFQSQLNSLHLENCADRSYREMSSGELERAALASILSQKPDLLLLDEVLSSQSGQSAAEILAKVLQQAKQDGTTVILASHDQKILAQCDRILHIDRGNIHQNMTDFPEKSSHSTPFEELASKCACSKTKEISLPGSELVLTEYIKGISENICLRLNNVCYGFQDKQLFTNLNIFLREGTLYHLTGPSGSGKSTLLQIMAGLIYVNDGEVLAFDQSLPRSGRQGWTKIGRVHHQSYLNNIRKYIGYAGQHADRQLFRDTVFDDVAFAPQNFGLNGEDLKAAQVKALYNMRIDESFWKRSSMQLSIGEQRKVALAGVAAAEPLILMLDDPYAELDQNGIESLNRMIMNYLDIGRTIVIAEE